jgi:acyl carrier protein
MDGVLALRQAWCELLGVPNAEPDQDFFGLGGDSLVALELIEQVEAASGWTIPVEVLFSDGTLGALLAAHPETK